MLSFQKSLVQDEAILIPTLVFVKNPLRREWRASRRSCSGYSSKIDKVEVEEGA